MKQPLRPFETSTVSNNHVNSHLVMANHNHIDYKCDHQIFHHRVANHDKRAESRLVFSPSILAKKNLRIANEQSLSLTLDGDGGIAAPKKLLSMF